MQQLEAGRLDLMPDVGASDTRSLRFDFHQEPALFSWSQIYERSGAGITTLLRKAIENKALSLHLQPQVNVHGQIISMEALLRMTDPELGPLSPADFIPVAESSGQIVQLGEWVMEQSCILLGQWQKADQMKHLRLAVNVSPRQFLYSGFADHVGKCLKKYKVPGSSLVLEVTEGLLIDDVESTIRKMQSLEALGVRFALGNSLDIEVVAEGVETTAQLAHLQKMGCECFQGFYFGRPRPADDWPAIMAGQSTQGV